MLLQWQQMTVLEDKDGFMKKIGYNRYHNITYKISQLFSPNQSKIYFEMIKKSIRQKNIFLNGQALISWE